MEDPIWQPDDSVNKCPICHVSFTFFYRRHHCRRCGKVVCGDCSDTKTIYNANDKIVSAPLHLFLESVNTPHRTCDICVEEMVLANTESQGGSTSDLHSLPMRVPSKNVKDMTVHRTRLIDHDSERDICPICGENIATRSEQAREEHVNSCLTKAEFSGTPDQKRTSNRMLVYDVPYPEKKPLIVSCSESTLPDSNSVTNEKQLQYEECVICLEELLPGEKVGRLECLCVFHYKCIKDWFKKKGPGDCPVHAIHLT